MKTRISDHFTYRKLIRFVLPSVMMLVFISVYGVVDGFFISNYAGKTAFAAINLILPVLMILGGMGFMIGTGGSALVAMSLGQKKETEANAYFSMLIEFTVVLGVLLTVLGEIFLRRVSIALGATSEMLPDCLIYGRIWLLLIGPFMLQSLFQSMLITAGKPQLGFGVTVAAGFANMLLDYLFVAVFRRGVAGAAAATALSQCVGGLIPLIYFAFAENAGLRFRPVGLRMHPLLKACGNGSSELMSNVSSSLVSIVYNIQLLRHAGENGVAAYGVMMYVNFIFIAMFIGYSVGTAPIVSFHYGAGNADELKNMLKKSTHIMAVSGVLMTAVAELFAYSFAKIFVSYDAGLLALTVQGFRIFCVSFLLCGLNIYISSFFTALNNGAVSAAVSFLRSLVFELLAVLLLPLILGLTGIWAAVSVAEVMAFAVSMFFLVWNRDKYHY